MPQNQLQIFKQRSFGKVAPTQIVQPVVPTGESSIMATLPTYRSYLQGKYAEKTVKMYWGDIKELSLYFQNKKIGEITPLDLQQWIGTLIGRQGNSLDKKTINRKVSAVINYFLWLMDNKAIEKNPTENIQNQRIQSPLPDYLYENEIKILYAEACRVSRIYLMVLLLLETGMKSNELLNIKIADVDISDTYNPELWIKHKGKDVKKDRKVALPQQFVQVYQQYIAQFAVSDILFPYTDRFIQMLFVELKKQTQIDKELTPKTLRHTHVVRAYRRGEGTDRIFERIGLAPDSRKEAGEVYSRLSTRGI